jgi:hypothetical protein
MSTVLTAKSINVSKIQFSAPKTLQNQSRTVYVNYENSKLRVQTPLMILPYGVGDNEKINAATSSNKKGEEVQAKRYDLNVSFRGMDTNPKLKELYDKMREIENRVIDEAFENRQVWLRDDYDGVKAFVSKLFTPIVKHDKNKDTGKIENKYPPTMKIKIPYDENTDTFQFQCTNMDGDDVDFKTIMTKLKGAKARLIIQFGGIWFAGQRYGCSWRIIRAKFEVPFMSNKVDFLPDSDDEGDNKKSSKQITEYDEDVEEDALENASKVTPPKNIEPSTSKNTKAPTKAASRIPDDTFEDDSDTEEAPPPPPTFTKKATQPPAPAPPPDEDDDDEDGVEEEEEEDEDPVPPPPPPPTKGRKTTKK